MLLMNKHKELLPFITVRALTTVFSYGSFASFLVVMDIVMSTSTAGQVWLSS
jgi:hypothetical protein